MKNYHFTRRIVATLFKWIALDITFYPEDSALFKFSIDWKKKCSMPGLFVNLTFLKFFTVWFSIFDSRVFDEKTKTLVDPEQITQEKLSVEEVKCANDLLGDLVYWSPKLDQMFHRHQNIPGVMLDYKQQLNDLTHDMERYLRSIVSEKS